MRIGLIAMSGVRVVNPKLVELGVTLPQFVNRGKVIAQLPSLALLVLAAVSPDDVEVNYHEAMKGLVGLVNMYIDQRRHVRPVVVLLHGPARVIQSDERRVEA